MSDDTAEETKAQTKNPIVAVKITDVLGLSQPMKKFLDYVGSGCGVLYKPTQIRREAKAHADSIRILAQSAEETTHLPVEISYQGESIQLAFDKSQTSTEPLTTQDRALQRNALKIVKDQENLESVLSVAAEELQSVQNVPDDSPDDDWVNRFFRYAEEISTEEMQDLWGRVLAGKIRRPDSFGLRTLDFLRNMSREEAEILELAAQYTAENYEGQFFILSSLIGINNQLDYAITLRLGELGLLAEDSSLKMQTNLEPKQMTLLYAGSQAVTIVAGKEAFSKEVGARPYTNIGCELLRLIKPKIHESVLRGLLVQLFDNNCTLTTGTVVSRTSDGHVRLDDQKIITKSDIEKM